MELKYKLLEHPFYQSWTTGTVTMQQLADYSKSYMDFIQRIPEYWAKSINGLNFVGQQASEIVQDELAHIPLWEKWASKLQASESAPVMQELIDTFDSMTASELLGAIHAFEIQQPEVARTKKEGLMKHYGFSEEDTIYFTEHFNEQPHIIFGRKLADSHSNINEFNNGFDKGAELIYRSLDLFMSERYC